MKRFLVSAAVVAAGMSAVPSNAMAAPIDDAERELASAPLWVDPHAGRVLDSDVVVEAIGDAPIKIAILPAGPSVSEVRIMPRMLARALPGNTTAVIAGRYFYAGSEVLCKGEAGQAAWEAIEANEIQLDAKDNSDLTDALIDFVAAVRAAPRCDGQGSRADRYADEPGGGEVAGGDDTATVLPWVAGGVGVGVIGVGAWAGVARRRSRTETEALRQEAQAAVEALAGKSAYAGMACYAEASTLLLAATTNEQYRKVIRVAHGEEPS